MLKLIAVDSSEQKKELIKESDGLSVTWVVSDLCSKLSIRQEMLTRQSYLEDQAVLRISELWRALARKAFPEHRIAPMDLISVVVQKLVDKSAERYDREWLRRPGASKAVVSYMGQLISILNHPNGLSIVAEWFAEHPQAQARWGGWLSLCSEIWQELKAGKIFPMQWISGLLLDLPEINDQPLWDRPLIIDVGAELTSIEVELIKKISDLQEVTVIVPRPEWHANYEMTLHSYTLLEEHIAEQKAVHRKVVEKGPASSKKVAKKEFLKFTTMAAEVKNAVAKIRTWLEQGVELEDIAVVASNIEVYWPILQMHLECEGVPFNKKTMLRVHSLPIVAQWLCNLRLQFSPVNPSDLETSYYGSGGNDEENKNRKLSYEEFLRLYKVVYDRDDLKRSSEIKKMYFTDIGKDNTQTHSVMNIESFLQWGLKYWPSDQEETRAKTSNIKTLELIIDKTLQETPNSIFLSLERWKTFLESILSRIEIENNSEYYASSGISCINLMSSEHLKSNYRILMGVEESALKVNQATGVPLMDSISLGQQTGFYLPAVDHDKLEFECSWFLEQPIKELLVSCAETDFDGTALAPSVLWIQGHLDSNSGIEEKNEDKLHTPELNRWDEIQNHPEDLSSQTSTVDLQSAIDGELGGELGRDLSKELGGGQKTTFFTEKVKKVSATMIERYLECPFRFAAEKIFGLSDLPSLDLDVDHMTRGTLMHALFEKLVDDSGDLIFSADGGSEKGINKDELLKLIDQVRKEKEILLADERLWEPLRHKYFLLCCNFLEFEKKWRDTFPQTKTMGREVKIDGLIDIDSGKFVAESEKNLDGKLRTFRFRGSIDRVDLDQSGNVAVIDYKSSNAGLKQFASQLEGLKVQLALYTQAFEVGLADGFDKNEVIAALYYVSKKNDREIGFKLEEKEGTLYDFSSRKRNKISVSEKESILADVNAEVRDVLQGIYRGEFTAHPENLDICQKCRWSNLCRSPHLN